MRSNVRRKPPHSEPSPPLSPLPPQEQSLQGLWKLMVPAFLMLYLLCACLHASWVPIEQTGYQNAPDEAAHVSFVRSLQSAQLPMQSQAEKDTTGKSYEWHQPPLYYAWVCLFGPLGERGMRLASIVLGVVCLLLIYQAARLLFPNDPLITVVATGFAALLPTHIAITSTVNNDVLTEALFSAVILLLLQSFLSGLTFWRACCLGLILGAALLTKATALLLIPVIGVGLLLLYRGGEASTKILRAGSLIFCWALVLSGWWFLRNQRLYGEFLPLKVFMRAFAGTAQAQPWIERIGLLNYVELVTRWTFQSFWAVFGNSNSSAKGIPLFLPEEIYLLPLAITVVAAVGLVRLHFRHTTQFTEIQRRGILLLMGTFGLVAVSFVSFLTKYFQTQGRYLFPAMLPISLLVSVGWLAIFPPKYKLIAAGILLGMMILLTLLFLTSVQAAI